MLRKVDVYPEKNTKDFLLLLGKDKRFSPSFALATDRQVSRKVKRELRER